MNTVSYGDIETVVVHGEVLIDKRSVKPMHIGSVRAAATRQRERFQTCTSWKTSFTGSRPPDKPIFRFVSARSLLRTMKQYGRGVVNQQS